MYIAPMIMDTSPIAIWYLPKSISPKIMLKYVVLKIATPPKPIKANPVRKQNILSNMVVSLFFLIDIIVFFVKRRQSTYE